MNNRPELSTPDIIKLFTAVPATFVDDFYSLYDRKNIGEKYIIDFDKLSQWLDVDKKNLLRTLRSSYKRGDDFIETKEKIKNREIGIGNHYKLKVMLTSDCMKRLCMRSRSEKAETVRTYFIEIDEFINHYSDQIVDGIVDDIEKLQKNNNLNDGPGYLYIFKVAKHLNKIGYTDDLKKRLSTYNTGRATDVKLLYTYRVEHKKEVEQCVKEFMKEKRFKKRREIYKIDSEIIVKLIKYCATMSFKLHFKSSNTKLEDSEQYDYVALVQKDALTSVNPMNE